VQENQRHDEMTIEEKKVNSTNETTTAPIIAIPNRRRNSTT
ncbi:36858_t:CDS:1, partial [Racocetra persica]